MGAYYDVIADFGLIIGVFIVFTVREIYPSWILAIIVILFVILTVTSLYGTQIYDPIGRYWGALLYATIPMTILVPTEEFYIAAQCSHLGVLRGVTGKQDQLVRTEL